MNKELFQATVEIDNHMFEVFMRLLSNESIGKAEALAFLYRSVHDKIGKIRDDEDLEKRFNKRLDEFAKVEGRI